jgi:MFS family permease
MSFTSARSCWPDVYLSAGVRGVSIGGDMLAATALALALQSAGAGGPAVSALLVAAVLPLVVLAPLTGRLVDRVDSRVLLVAVGSAQAAVCAALAYAERPAVVVALVALLSCGLAVTQPALAALLPAMVHRDDLPRAAAITQTATSVGALAAPALAGFLVDQFGVRVPVLVDAASYLAVVAAGMLLRTRRNSVPSAASSRRERGQGLTADPLLRAMTFAMAGMLAGVGAINVIAIFFIRDTLGASATAYGLVEAAWTTGMLAGTWLLGRAVRRLRDDGAAVQALLAMLAGTSVIILAGAAVPGVLWLLPLWLAGGALNGGENVISNVVIGRRVAPEARGRAFATFVATVLGASMIGYFAGGLLLAWAGPRPLVALAGLAGVLMVALFVAPVRRAARAGEREGWDTAGEGSRAGPDHGGYGANHGRVDGPPQGRAHPVPQLPADLLGPDALRRSDRRRPAQGHARPAQRGVGRR